MKKVIGIYCGAAVKQWDSETIKTEGLGGSESWAIYLADEFAKAGFHVILFGNPKNYYFNEYGVEYIPYYLYDNRLSCQHFDYFIASRRVDCIVDELSCDNIYLICHDNQICLLPNYETLLTKLGRIKKVILLSEFQQQLYLNQYPTLNYLNTSIIHHGIDVKLYDMNMVKKNQMVWSSCYERGFEQFAQYILPLIREKVPDFNVIATCYDHNQKIQNQYEGVTVLSGLNKADLARIQCESKIWIYPPTFSETFCLSLAENVFAKNAPILADVGSLRDIVPGYKAIFGNNYLNIDYSNNKADIDLDSYKETAQYIADLAVELLTNEEKRMEYVNQAYEICKEYTWKNSAKEWFNLWFKDYNSYMGE